MLNRENEDGMRQQERGAGEDREEGIWRWHGLLLWPSCTTDDGSSVDMDRRDLDGLDVVQERWVHVRVRRRARGKPGMLLLLLVALTAGSWTE